MKLSAPPRAGLFICAPAAKGRSPIFSTFVFSGYAKECPQEKFGWLSSDRRGYKYNACPIRGWDFWVIAYLFTATGTTGKAEYPYAGVFEIEHFGDATVGDP